MFNGKMFEMFLCCCLKVYIWGFFKAFCMNYIVEFAHKWHTLYMTTDRHIFRLSLNAFSLNRGSR